MTERRRAQEPVGVRPGVVTHQARDPAPGAAREDFVYTGDTAGCLGTRSPDSIRHLPLKPRDA
mgnify:CR=1 FL=1